MSSSRRRRRRRRHARSPAASPLEDDDLLSEILLRLPPQPSSLPRASLVCRRWRRLVSDPGFSGRFRLRHRRSPPLLGYFYGDDCRSFVPTLEAPNRVSPGRFSFQPGNDDRFSVLGCHHGLVLMFNITRNQILVWDPSPATSTTLPFLRGVAIHAEKTTFNGAVLRPAGDVQNIQVVLVVGNNEDKEQKRAVACVYSSKTGVWGDPISTPVPSKASRSHHPLLILKPAVLAGASLYWMLAANFVGILEFDLQKQSLAVIRVPVHMLEEGHYLFSIMRAEGGGLGLFFYTDRKLQLWKWKTDYNGVASWGLGRTIELDKLFPNLEENDITILG